MLGSLTGGLGSFPLPEIDLSSISEDIPEGTAIALGMGYWRHRHALVPALGVAGVFMLVVAAFGMHALGAESVERAVTVAGGLLLAAAHIQNYRLTRSSHACHHERAHVSGV